MTAKLMYWKKLANSRSTLYRAQDAAFTERMQDRKNVYFWVVVHPNGRIIVNQSREPNNPSISLAAWQELVTDMEIERES